MNNKLTFEELRRANVHRLPQFKDKLGRVAHSQSDGSDWSIAEWLNAVAGETGEACNLAKKMRRGDFGAPGSPEYNMASHELMKELADIVIYADIAAFQLRRELGAYVQAKFNEVSERIGCEVRIG